MSWSSFMTLLDMAARENDSEYTGPPPEVDPLQKQPGHRGSGSSSTDTNANTNTPSTSTEGEGGKSENSKLIEKTISCVSCRKRKLKCDRVKPKWLRHDCEYPERRRNLGSKRRNMKELEARLAQVETQLVTEQQKSSSTQAVTTNTSMSIEADWNDLGMDMNMDNIDTIDISMLSNVNFSTPNFSLPLDSQLPMGDIFSQELLELGLKEPLPPQEMMDELHQIYFEKYHPQVPFMHKYRYYASLSKSPKFRPPVCLRYAMWAVAASITDKYRCYEDLLYERARRYIQDAEMKGHGEGFVSIYYAQCWGLISTFEARKTYFSRSWMSTGRMVRLVQMLGLYRLDIDSAQSKQILPPPRDWIELEERRRTFWGAYYGDRWASSGTGWPMLINEDEIQTNLPSSEDAFDQGMPENSITLAEALTPNGARTLSPFGGVIFSATLFGHNFVHLHKTGPAERPEDPSTGEFWKRHRKMDNVLSNTFMFLPDRLRLPEHARNMNVAFLHMNIHSSAICLHQAAILTAKKYGLENVVEQSRARCLLAAEEITNIMHLICHIDKTLMHAWIGFCLYVAAGVFIKDTKFPSSSPSAITNLEFLLSAMRSIGTKHSVTNHFTAQIELDMLAAGIGTPNLQKSVEEGQKDMPSLPIAGIDPDRHGLPMTYGDLQDFVGPGGKSGSTSGASASAGLRNENTPSSHSGASPDNPSDQCSTWDPNSHGISQEERQHLAAGNRNNGNSSFYAANMFSQQGENGFGNGIRVFDMDMQGNSMSFPIRGSTPLNHGQSPPGMSSTAPWSNTAAVLGSGLKEPNRVAEVGDNVDMQFVKGPNGFSMSDGSQGTTFEQQKSHDAEHVMNMSMNPNGWSLPDSGGKVISTEGLSGFENNNEDAEAWRRYCGTSTG